MSVAELERDEVGRRRENPRLVPGEPASSVDELAEELERVSHLAREELERRGATSRSAHLERERHRCRCDLALEAPDHPVLLREAREAHAREDQALEDQALEFMSTIGGPATTGQGWAKIAGTPAVGTSRMRAISRLSGKLLSQGVDGELVVELMRAQNRVRCLPPLGNTEVERIVRWVASREADRLEGAA